MNGLAFKDSHSCYCFQLQPSALRGHKWFIDLCTVRVVFRCEVFLLRHLVPVYVHWTLSLCTLYIVVVEGFSIRKVRAGAKPLAERKDSVCPPAQVFLTIQSPITKTFFSLLPT